MTTPTEALAALIREVLVANLFDGDDGGTTTQRIATLVTEASEVVAEHLTTSSSGWSLVRTEGLEAAWAEAEAAVPHRGDRRLSWLLRLTDNGKGTYHAEYLPPLMPYQEWMEAHREGFGDTAVEALRDLAKGRP